MIEYLKKRILNGLALGYKLNDVPEFLLVKSGLNFIIKKEENEQISKTDRKLKLNVNVVSLRFRCDRRIQMVAGLKSSKIPYKIHHAVHGKSIKPHQITANQFSKQSIKYLSSGSIGAIISHYQLWVDLLD